MADGSVVFSTELDDSGLKNGLSKLGGASAKWAGTAVKGVGVALGAVTTGIGALAKSAISYNNQMENYTTNFGVMLGDEAAAIEHVAKLREMAAKTPFGIEELADASQTMISFGLSAEDSMTAMQQLGDISLGNKERFNSLSLAFSQISAAGKLSGQDLLQMVNAGFNPLNTIAEKTGTNLGDLKEVMAGKKGSKEFLKQMKAAKKEVKKMGDDASDGAKLLAQIGEEGMISAEMVGKAMEIETSPGGKFYNGMQKASETFSGMVSTLQDDAMEFAGKVFDPLTQSMTKNLLPLAQGYLNTLSAAFDEGGIDGLITAVGDVLSDATTKVAENLPDVLGLASSLLSKIATGLTENVGTLSGGITDAITAIATSGLPETMVTSLTTLAGSLISSLATGLSENGTEIIGGIAGGLVAALESGLGGDIILSLGSLAQALIGGIGDALPDLLPALAKGLIDGIGAAFTTLTGFGDAAGKLIEGLKKGLFGDGGKSGAIDVLGQEIINGLNSFLATTFPTLNLKLPSWKELKASITESWNKLKASLEEFFTVTLGIKFFKEGDYGGYFDEEEVTKLQEWMTRKYEGTGGILGSLIPSATAEELPEEATTANDQFSQTYVNDFNQSLLEAFESGALTYDELVAKMMPSEGFETAEPETGEGNGETNPIAQKIISMIINGLTALTPSFTQEVATMIAAGEAAADVSGFRDVGYQIASGMASGVKSGQGILVSAVQKIIKAALTTAKKTAKIHSPSQLFRDEIGAMLTQGVAEGVSSKAFVVRKAVNNMVVDSMPDMRRVNASTSALLSGYSSGIVDSARAASYGSFSQTNNFNVPYATPDEVANTMYMYATYGLAAER